MKEVITQKVFIKEDVFMDNPVLTLSYDDDETRYKHPTIGVRKALLFLDALKENPNFLEEFVYKNLRKYNLTADQIRGIA